MAINTPQEASRIWPVVPSTPDIRTETSALLDNGPESASAMKGILDPLRKSERTGHPRIFGFAEGTLASVRSHCVEGLGKPILDGSEEVLGFLVLALALP